MRLFQIIAGGEFGGFETFFVSLSTELAAMPGVEQRLATRPWPSRIAQLESTGAELLPLALGGTLDFRSALTLRRDIGRWSPDIILAWANRGTRAAPRLGIPIVARIGHYYKLKNYRHTDYLITITRGLRDFAVAGGYPADRVAVIPNFHRRSGLAAIPRQTFATPEGVPLVFAVGRLHKAKGFDVLLQSLGELPDAWLWLAGVGPEEEALKALAEELGLSSRVRFLGWRDDVEALMSAADVVAMPSRSEGLGTVILEAWASGTPLVAAASEGPSELIADGETGRLVPTDDAAALAAALREVIGDPAHGAALVASATETYETGYTAERIAARYLETLTEFARRGARSGPGRLALTTPDSDAVKLREAMAPARGGPFRLHADAPTE